MIVDLGTRHFPAPPVGPVRAPLEQRVLLGRNEHAAAARVISLVTVPEFDAPLRATTTVHPYLVTIGECARRIGNTSGATVFRV